MKQGLILVDIQNDYFSGGNLELVGIEQAANNARKVLQQFRDNQASIFHIQHISKQLGERVFLEGTNGAYIHESVAPQSGEAVIIKHFPNSFRETNLLAHLKNSGVEEVTICGAMSHMCIDATTRAAFDFGFQCVVIHSSSRDCIRKLRSLKNQSCFQFPLFPQRVGTVKFWSNPDNLETCFQSICFPSEWGHLNRSVLLLIVAGFQSICFPSEWGRG